MSKFVCLLMIVMKINSLDYKRLILNKSVVFWAVSMLSVDCISCLQLNCCMLNRKPQEPPSKFIVIFSKLQEQ